MTTTMKFVQGRTCPLCAEYRSFRCLSYSLDAIDQTRTCREGRNPTAWHHVGRLGKFLHEQAKAWKTAQEPKEA